MSWWSSWQRELLLSRCELRRLLQLVSSLYGCSWRRRNTQSFTVRPGDACCCSKLEGGALAVLVVTFLLTMLFLFFWGYAQNDYNDFDWFNFVNLGFWFRWSLVLLVVTAGFFTYISVLMLLAVCLLSAGQKLQLHWSHKVGLLLTLTFSVAATAVLSDLWSEEWTTLLLSFQVTSPYLHVGGVLLMTALSWPIAFHFHRMTSRGRRVLLLSLYLLLLSALYVAPLLLHSPCIKEGGALGPPPALIGHRGAPMLAPENTLMSFEKAVETGSDGLETDVTISLDGVPFLMHDRTLRRTTNVHHVYPEHAHTPAAMFTWNQLQRLNAGEWFLKSDPFGSVSALSAEERLRAGRQTVCSLRRFLQLAADRDQLVIFDLYRPPRGHPYRDTWIQRTLDVVHNESSIRSSQVLWLPSDLRDLVQDLDPDLQQTSGTRIPLDQLHNNNIVAVNLHYSNMDTHTASAYAAANVSTNLYVVNRPWLYSVAWCWGVDSVTTNSPHDLSTVTAPLLLMSPDEFRLTWILTELLSLLLLILVFLFHWWRERSLQTLSTGSNLQLDSSSYGHFKTGSPGLQISVLPPHSVSLQTQIPVPVGPGPGSGPGPGPGPAPEHATSTLPSCH